MKRTTFPLAIMLLLMATLFAVGFGPVSIAATTPATKKKPVAAGQTAKAPSSNWIYRTTTDKMRGTAEHFASVYSKNSLSFDFPYQGGKAELTLRNRPTDGLNIFLQVEGQFLCNSYSGDSVSVKFDDGPIDEYECSEPDSGTTGLLFIEDEEKFVTSLMGAKTVTIEANFYQAGPRQMEFNVAGLKWNTIPESNDPSGYNARVTTYNACAMQAYNGQKNVADECGPAPTRPEK